MLILTRKPGESIYIGDNIIITVSEIKGNQVRIGIKAPSEYKIYREEIYRQILEENQKAAEAAMSSEIGLESLGEAWRSRPGAAAQSPLSSKLGVQSVTRKTEDKAGPLVTHKKRKTKTDNE